jgi:hypothetical protein
MPFTLLHVLSVERDGTEPAAGERENHVGSSSDSALDYALHIRQGCTSIDVVVTKELCSSLRTVYQGWHALHSMTS